MKVRDLCVRSVRTCSPDTTLAAAGWNMWEGDCGVLPLVDADNKVIGILTDRDICMAAATRFRPAAEITAGEVSSGKVHTCRLDDDVRQALETMRTQAVRRLPVVDENGRLRGLLSMNDVALAARSAGRGRANGVTYDDLVPALQGICAHRDGSVPAEKPSISPPSRVTVGAAT